LSKKKRFVIRSTTLDDAKDISNLYKEVWDNYRGIFPDELTAARQPSPTEMKQWLENDSYIVAIINDKPVGVVGITCKHGACLLIHMVVKEMYRGIGIGSALVEKVIEFAKEYNASKVWLDTVPILEEAIKLYIRYGFKKCGHLQKHYWGADVELYELLL
jgi:GNAT superfamily N-acetyltransferase